jgi:hypothetical protein
MPVRVRSFCHLARRNAQQTLLHYAAPSDILHGAAVVLIKLKLLQSHVVVFLLEGFSMLILTQALLHFR